MFLVLFHHSSNRVFPLPYDVYGELSEINELINKFQGINITSTFSNLKDIDLNTDILNIYKIYTDDGDKLYDRLIVINKKEYTISNITFEIFTLFGNN